MTARMIGLALGPLAFAVTALAPAPAGMSGEAWLVAGLVIWMAAWWMTEAVPLAVTALLPFIILPLAGVMDARATASAYYAPILFLLLGYTVGWYTLYTKDLFGEVQIIATIPTRCIRFQR